MANSAASTEAPAKLQTQIARHKRLGRYGMELILDLHDCDPVVIRSKDRLKAYVDQLCALLKMKPYGKTLLPYFGLSDPRTAGYSLLQFIETSSVTGHFSELWNSAYLNVFSCQPFDPDEALTFTKRFFKPKRLRRRLLLRG